MKVQLLALAMTFCVALGARAQKPMSPAGDWSSVPLPEQPLGVFAHGGALWVCGASGMIAVSRDAGRTWTVLRRKRGGAMLFHLYFPAPNEIVAFGSDRVRLQSADGGETWQRRNFRLERQFALAAFSGPRIELGARGNSLAWTDDAGQHWKLARIRSQLIKLPAPVQALAAAPGGRAIALASQIPRPQFSRRGKLVANSAPQPPQMTATTCDGGRHWHPTSLPRDISWLQVRASPGGFFIYGVKKPHQAEAAFSAGGVHWHALLPPRLVYSECQAAGCLVDEGWVDLTGAAPALYARPPDSSEPLTISWAAVGNTFCRVSSQLRCRIGHEPWQRPAQLGFYSMERDGMVFQARKLPGPAFQNLPGSVGLMVLVGRNGRVEQVLVTAATRKHGVHAVLAAVRRWRFVPQKIAGQPAAFSFFIGMIYQ